MECLNFIPRHLTSKDTEIWKTLVSCFSPIRFSVPLRSTLICDLFIVLWLVVTLFNTHHLFSRSLRSCCQTVAKLRSFNTSSTRHVERFVAFDNMFCCSKKNPQNIQILMFVLSDDVPSRRLAMSLVAYNNGAVREAAEGMG